MRVTRRAFLKSAAAVTATLDAAGLGNAVTVPSHSGPHTIVVGAGVFGAWTAWHLQRRGHAVRLIDAWGPAHSRASSGGESRLTRTEYGGDELYTRMAWESLDDWRWLSSRSGLPIFHPIGALYFYSAMASDVEESIALHKRMGIAQEILDCRTLVARYPQVSWDGIEFGLFEPELGVLMARRAVQTLVMEFIAAGGIYENATVLQPADVPELAQLRTAEGTTLTADSFVFACGPWLPKLFPKLVAERILPVRMEVFYFVPDAGDRRFDPQRLPAWVDVPGGLFYGFPDLEGRGFKVAHDKYGPVVDPDLQDRQYTPARLTEARAFLKLRFPDLADRPLAAAEVCQYELTDTGDFLIDRHPDWKNVWILGGGSGHGFKHGPAVGEYAADMVAGKLARPEPRFELATKKAVRLTSS